MAIPRVTSHTSDPVCQAEERRIDQIGLGLYAYAIDYFSDLKDACTVWDQCDFSSERRDPLTSGTL